MIGEGSIYFKKPSKRRNRHFLRNWLILLLVLGGIFIGIKGYWSQLTSPVDPAGIPEKFTVSSGEGTSTIADHLEHAGLIRSSLAFKLEVKLFKKGSTIEAGDFMISPSESVDQVIQTLSKGVDDTRVTLIEGQRDEEFADKLSLTLGISKTDFLNTAKEGYMFPDTYDFQPNSTAQEVAQKMEDTFNSKYTPDLQSKIQNLGLTPDQGVILASIVEREGRSDKFKQQVASILLKRLKIGMALDVDSTIQFALGYQPEEKTWWKKAITAEDKKINSPYNTYLYPGLPPGPICNPGLSSLEAVANADPSTPYLYYYNDSQGSSYFGKTLQEHEQNIKNHP